MGTSADRCGFLSGVGWGVGLAAAVFFVCCFLFLLLVVEPGLVYFAFGDLIDFPEFSFDYSFFAERVYAPGGAVGYVSDFLSQWFYYSWAGALIITAVAFGVWLCSHLLIGRVSGIRRQWAGFVPALAVVMLFCHYNHQLAVVLALLTATVFAMVYAKYAPGRAWARITVFAGMFVLLYVVAGGASLMFAVLTAICDLLRKRWISTAVNLAVAAAAPYAAGVGVFLLDCPTAYLRHLPLLPLSVHLRMVSMVYVYLSLAGSVLLVGLWGKVRARSGADKKHKAQQPKKVKSDKSEGRLFSGKMFKTACGVVCLAGVSLGGLCLSFDGRRKNMLMMHSLVRQEKWEAFLEAVVAAQREGYYNAQVNFDVNRAFFHLGRLGDDMFSYMQLPNGLFLFGREKIGFSSQYLRVSQICYELGNVNEAEHWAYEILETEGVSPIILRRLADINLVKGQIAAARVFLNALSKDLISGAYARQRLMLLERDPELKTDEVIVRLRSCLWRDDKAPPHSDPENVLLDLLKANPKNRMAFEYLMAIYLLTHNRDRLAANLWRLDDFGCERIPRHYEEAVMIARSMGKTVDLGDRKISGGTQARFAGYMETLRKYGSKQAALGALAAEYGDTYFFYSMFGMSGARR